MSEKKRLIAEEENTLGDPVGRNPSNIFTGVGIGLLCTLVVVAWVLFIRYSI